MSGEEGTAVVVVEGEAIGRSISAVGFKEMGFCRSIQRCGFSKIL